MLIVNISINPYPIEIGLKRSALKEIKLYSAFHIHSPDYASIEETEEHIECQRAPDHKMVDPRPVPCVHGQLKENEYAENRSRTTHSNIHRQIQTDQNNPTDVCSFPVLTFSVTVKTRTVKTVVP